MYSAVKYEHTRFSGLGELVHNCIGMCHVTIENYAKYCSFKIKARCLAQLIGSLMQSAYQTLDLNTAKAHLQL